MPKRGIIPRGGKQKVSRGWFSFLWSPKEAEGREWETNTVRTSFRDQGKKELIHISIMTGPHLKYSRLIGILLLKLQCLWRISIQMWPFCTIKSNVMQKCIAYWKHVAILPKSDSVHNKCIFKEMQSLKSDNLLCQLHIYKHICREMSNCSMKCFYICKYEFQSVG